MDQTNMWVVISLFLLGLCAGSFVNALVWRVNQTSKIKHQKSKSEKTIDSKLPTTNYSILNGRSVCPNCRHNLAAKDLVPLFSWLSLRGRCRYCKKPISTQYPIVELAGGLIFAASYLLWPVDIIGLAGSLLYCSWLLTSVGLLALLVYDYRWMLLPNRIIYPTLAVAVFGRLTYILIEGPTPEAVANWVLSVAIASGIFWLIFYLSKGKWIGYGDVRLGLITGTVLAKPSLSLLMIFVASVLGTLFVAPSLLSGNRKTTSQIPFGPFLIAGTFLALIFGQAIIDWYLNIADLSNT